MNEAENLFRRLALSPTILRDSVYCWIGVRSRVISFRNRLSPASKRQNEGKKERKKERKRAKRRGGLEKLREATGESHLFRGKSFPVTTGDAIARPLSLRSTGGGRRHPLYLSLTSSVKCSKAILVIASRKFYKATHEPSLSTLVLRPWLYNSWSLRKLRRESGARKGKLWALRSNAYIHTHTHTHLPIWSFQCVQAVAVGGDHLHLCFQ